MIQKWAETELLECAFVSDIAGEGEGEREREHNWLPNSFWQKGSTKNLINQGILAGRV